MNYFKRIANLALPYWKQIVVISLLILVISGLSQAEPIVLKQITDAIVNQGQNYQGTIPKTIVLFLGIYLVVKLLNVLVNRFSWHLATLFTYKLRFSLREQGFEHLLSLSQRYFNEKQSGQLMSQLDRGSTQITQIINNSGMHFLPNLVAAIIGLIIVMNFNFWIGLSIVLVFIPVALFNYWRFRKNEKLEHSENLLYDNQYGHFWETISSAKIIKSFVAEAFELKRLQKFNKKIFTIRKKAERNHNIFVFTDLFLEAWIWVVYAWVVYLTFKGQFSLGTMVLVLSYIYIIREPLWLLNWVFWEAKRAQIGAREFFGILDQKPDIVSPKHPLPFNEISGRITFDHISFAYAKGAAVFDKVSFDITPGQTCALVGKSGAGKTTVADLINRFYDVQKGKILIDGHDIKKIDLKALRRNIGFVTQEPYLFAETIEENLRYGNPKATLAQMKIACQVAHAHEFIKALPKGYKTKIGERGVTLSGGQKQRLSLARVILKNPPILVLDEATSALDSHSEMLIQQALEKITKGRTSIIIAHRLSTIQKADCIIVLGDGGILEMGNHEQLLAKKGLYASLFAIQSGQQELLKEWELE
ncbi:ABC transporter ATP-binding protein [Candidatus Beckwithbacteria bacterium]|nr:ABC transporter ATP-binding protein [Candidatus Beckwithbacteria bacterium]